MATNGIVLSSSVRTNLLSLQTTTAQQGLVQNRLATGKKVISALDNPTNFFTSAGLTQRANDLNALLDGISNGVKTLEAASNGATSISKVIETMQANVRQARQDRSFKGEVFSISSAATGDLSISGGSVGTSPVTVPLVNGTEPVYTAGAFTALDVADGDENYSFSVAKNGGTPVTINLGAADNTGGGTTLDQPETMVGINSRLAAANSTIRVRDNAGKLEFYDTDPTNLGTAASIDVGAATSTGTSPSAVANLGWTGDPAAATGAATGGTVKTVDQLVTDINSNTSLVTKVRASNDGGKLRIENLSVKDLTITGVSGATGEIDGSVGTKTVGLNEIRKNLVSQFNDLRDQLDKIAGDSGYNGVNLLRGDKLKVVFNERATSSISIEARNRTGLSGVSTATNSLDIPPVTEEEFSSDDSLDARFNELKDAMQTLQSQSSQLGANLGVVQIRQDFTKQMITTLQTGSDFLVNADMNEEGANLLALNTRQQLSQTALSLASQADQAVLRLFG
jgi:flagellin-like hook-associated protein FlgL